MKHETTKEELLANPKNLKVDFSGLVNFLFVRISKKELHLHGIDEAIGNHLGRQWKTSLIKDEEDQKAIKYELEIKFSKI